MVHSRHVWGDKNVYYKIVSQIYEYFDVEVRVFHEIDNSDFTSRFVIKSIEPTAQLISHKLHNQINQI